MNSSGELSLSSTSSLLSSNELLDNVSIFALKFAENASSKEELDNIERRFALDGSFRRHKWTSKTEYDEAPQLNVIRRRFYF